MFKSLNKLTGKRFLNQRWIARLLLLIDPRVVFLNLSGINKLILQLPEGSKILNISHRKYRTTMSLLKPSYKISNLYEPSILLEPKIDLTQKNIYGTSFSSEVFFDAIQVDMVLNKFVIKERIQLLKSIHDLLRPGGWILVVDLNRGPTLVLYFQRFFGFLCGDQSKKDFIHTDLLPQLVNVGFIGIERKLLLGGAFQRIIARIK